MQCASDWLGQSTHDQMPIELKVFEVEAGAFPEEARPTRGESFLLICTLPFENE